MVKGQFKIQQMAFMIVALLFFFILVGLFYVSYETKSIKERYEILGRREVVSLLRVVANMPELSCGDLCLDEDKLMIMSKENYDDFWPVLSIKVLKLNSNKLIKCPAPNCNYYEIYDSGKKEEESYSEYISICRTINKQGYNYEKCDIGKLILGVKIK